MSNNISKLEHLLFEAALSETTRTTVLETIADIEQEHTEQLQLEWRRKYETLHEAASGFREYLKLITGGLHILLDSDITLLNSWPDNLLNNAKEHLLYTNAVRDLCEIKLQRLNLNFRNVDIYQFLGEFEKLCQRIDVLLVAHRDNTIGSLTVDSKWLQQALLNLLFLSNHPPPGDGPVELIATRHGSVMQLAFNIRPLETKPRSIVEMYQELEDLYPTENGVEGYRLSVAYHLCRMIDRKSVV